jgi:N-acyl-D-aspartate/D-glutamate deacylase
MTGLDIVIGGGTVVDGSGAAGYAGTVAIEGDRLRVARAGTDEERALREQPAGRTIDASG